MWIENAILLILGVLFGTAVSFGFMAFIALVGVIPRLAAVTKSAKKILLYENLIVLGSGLFNIIYLFHIKIPVGIIGFLVFFFFAGVFIGCLAGAIAEVVKTFPIIARRVHLHKGIPYIIYSLAFGKLTGTIVQYYLFK